MSVAGDGALDNAEAGALETLDSLRQQIDLIDAELHRLIMARTDIVLQVRAAKGSHGAPIMRPGREIAIMRGLLARHQGPFPVPSLMRMWREMIGAFSQLQGAFRLAVWAPGDGSGLRGTARDYFGISVPLTPMTTPQSVVRALAEQTAEIGLVPVPEHDVGDQPWWPVLVRQEMQEIHIIGQLPLMPPPGQPPRAWILGRQNPEPTGADETVLVVTTIEKISRDRLNQLLSVFAAPYRLIGQPVDGPAGTVMYLVSVEGFFTARDAALSEMIAASDRQVETCHVLGCYPVIPVQEGKIS